MIKPEILVVPTTHWDRAWYWPFERFRIKLIDVFLAVFDEMNKHPEYRFNPVSKPTAAGLSVQGSSSLVPCGLNELPAGKRLKPDKNGCYECPMPPFSLKSFIIEMKAETAQNRRNK